RLFRDSARILEWHQCSAAVVQHLDRMPIRSRDDRLTCSQSISQRAGHYLCLMTVRSDVNIRGTYELNHLLRADEAVVEDHLWFHSHFLCQASPVSSIRVSFTAKY